LCKGRDLFDIEYEIRSDLGNVLFQSCQERPECEAGSYDAMAGRCAQQLEKPGD
jgi:hypothetical protein